MPLSSVHSMHATGLLHEDTTRPIVSRFFVVYNRLGYGFLESPYVNALAIELGKAGLRVTREQPVAIEYDGITIGTYRVDLMVQGKIIVEVKACASLLPEHERQVRNYLKCSSVEVGMLLNFGPKPDVRRFIFTNDRKRDGVADPHAFGEPKSSPRSFGVDP